MRALHALAIACIAGVVVAAASNPTDLKTKLALDGGDPDEVSDEERVMGPFEIESDTRF